MRPDDVVLATALAPHSSPHHLTHPMHLCIFIALLLAVFVPLRAADDAAPMGMLMFSTDKNPGKGGLGICKLSASGTYILYGNPHTVRGSLTAHETLRIFEEFEKLCIAAGVEQFLPDPRLGKQRLVPPFVILESPRVKMLAGPENPPPPALTEFLTILRQKLLYHASQHPAPPPVPAASAIPPPPALK